MLNASGEALLSLVDVNQVKMGVQGTGVTLFNLMELWRIDTQELTQIVTLLQ